MQMRLMLFVLIASVLSWVAHTKPSACLPNSEPDRQFNTALKQAFHGEIYDTEAAILLARHDPPLGFESLKGNRSSTCIERQQGRIHRKKKC